jgi:hypothetical protein
MIALYALLASRIRQDLSDLEHVVERVERPCRRDGTAPSGSSSSTPPRSTSTTSTPCEGLGNDLVRGFHRRYPVGKVATRSVAA